MTTAATTTLITYQSSGSHSLKPLANGLLAIFSCVICYKQNQQKQHIMKNNIIILLF